MAGSDRATVGGARGFCVAPAVLFLLSLIVGTFMLLPPDRAAAAGGTCSVNFGTVPYGSTNNTHVMAEGSAEQLACDPRYPAADSGVAPPITGSSVGGGTWKGVTNVSDNTLTYTPPPSFRGTDTFTMWFCNDVNCSGVGRLTATVTVTVSAPTVTLTPAPGALPGATVGIAYSQTLSASGGTSPHGFTVVAGTLPPGMSLGAVTPGQPSTVQLSGTPTAGGNYSFTIRAADSSTGAGPVTVDQAYTIAVAAPTITVNPPTITNGTQGSAYSPTTLTATGGVASYSFSVSSGALPTGMTLSSGGVLSGTPTQFGSFTFVARAQDSSGGSGPYSGTRSYTFNIAAVAPVTNAVSATVAHNSTNNPITLNITGGAPTSVAVPSGPSHGTVSPSGTTITYTPTAGYAGPDSFTYTATNTAGTSAAATVTITVSPPTIVVNPASLPGGTTGTAYSQAVTATGGTAAYTYSISVGALPAGLSIDPASGLISGTPTGSGLSNFTVRAQDSSSGPAAPFAGTRAYAVTIVAPNPPVANTVGATVGYNSGANPITLNITGGAPTSLAVASPASHGTATASGLTITYTPTTGYFGPDSFTYTATNADGTSSPATVSITVSPQPPVAGAASATVAFNSANNPITLDLSGGTATSVAIASPASHGTATASGTSITYTPTAGYSGADSFTYTATNAGGTSAPATVTITVNPAAPIANPVGATVAYGSTNNPITLNITGGAPASVTIATPAGHGSATASGTSITYTPTAGYSGPDSFTYTATNAGGTSSPATVSITVGPQPPVVGAASATVAFSSANNPITLDLSGGTATSVAVATPASHGTATASGTSITYTPTAGYSGADSFTYTATNAGGTSAAATVTITVNPAAPIANNVGVTLAANSTNAPITLNITGGAPASLATPTLPSHGAVSVSGTTITYTPTAGYSGPDSFTYTATNVTGTSAPATASITVSPPTLTLSAIAATGQATVPYSAAITASLGTASYSFSVTAGALPDGLSLDGDGTLSGTPTAPGPFNFTVTATDAYGATGSQAYAITVSAPTISITAPAAGALPGATGGTAYSQSFTASGGAGTHSFALTGGGLPTGMSFTSAGVLSGTPTVAGTFNLTMTATDSSPGPGGPFTSAPVAYSLTVAAPTITFTPASLPAAATAQAYSQSFTASGGTAPYSYALTAGGLPVGMSFTSAGVLSGAPTAAGTSSFTIEVTDTHGFTASNPYSVTVTDPTVTITAPAAGALPGATGGTAYSQSFTAGGGAGTHSFALTGGSLPAGMSFTSAGVLSGTPTVAGTFNLTMTVTDSSPPPGGPFTSAPVAYSLTVAAPTISVTPPSLPAATTAQAYSQAFSASGGTAPYSYAVTAGGLPAGMSFTSAGVLSGTPTAAGTSIFTIEVTDAHGFTASNPYTIVVTDPTVAITAPAAGALPAATAGTAYTVTVTASGGAGAYSFVLAGDPLPAGMSFNSAGVLSGIPTAAGTFNFTVTASDSSPAPGPFASAPVSYSLTVVAPTVGFTPASLPPATTTQAYSQNFSASGGAAPYGYTLAAGTLPPGMSLGAAGVLAGSPTAAGTYNFTIEVSDTNGFTASNPYTFTVTDPTVAVTAPAAGALPPATGGTAYSQSFTASGGAGAHAFALASGTLPAGLSLSSAGVLSGTPTASGTFHFAVTASDSSPAPGGPFTSAPVAYTLAVAPPAVILPPSPPGGLPETPADGPYSYTFTASGGTGPYTFTLTGGALPPGLSLSPAGVLSGTPTAPGTYIFSISARDSSPPPGPFTGLPRTYKLVIRMKDTEAPVFATFPDNIAVEVDHPATGAVVRWIEPTATDDRPGVTVAQSAGPSSGSSFPLGPTTIAYQARDAAGNTTDRSFTVTVTRREPGRVTFVVDSTPDGDFDFSSTEPALNFTVTTVSGSGSSGAIAVPAGRHRLTFTIPDGFAIAKAVCGDARSTLDAATLSGTITVDPGSSTTCTVSAADIRRTTALIGGFLAARSDLIIANAPDTDRRIERLTGAYTGQGGVSGFGLGFSNERLPFAMRFSENEASFGYSLRRARAERHADARVTAAHGAVSRGGGKPAAPIGGDDTALVTRLDQGARPPAAISPFDALHGITPDVDLPGANAMSTPFDVWVEGKLARFEAGGGDGRFGILHAGVDYLLTPRLLIGLGVQIDRTDMDGTEQSSIDGTGYLVGPYMTARLTDRLFFDARAAWGRSSNTVSPFGTYADKFDATRWLVSGALIGRYDIERWRIEPMARLSYFEEETDAYVDSLGFSIPQISVATGTFEFGPTLSYQMELGNGFVVAPYASLEGIWTFKQDNDGTAATDSPGLDETGLRGRGELGFTLSGMAASSLSASVFYDGVGNQDFQSWGGELRFNRAF